MTEMRTMRGDSGREEAQAITTSMKTHWERDEEPSHDGRELVHSRRRTKGGVVMTDKMTRCKGTARDAAQVQEHVSTKASTIFTLAKEHDLRKSSGCTCGRNECVRQSVWGHALHV